MKAHFRVIILFISGTLWFWLLGFLAVRLNGRWPWWMGGNLPSPWSGLIAVVVDLGLVFIAGMLVLRRSYPLKGVHPVFRWLVYTVGSVALVVVAAAFGALLSKLAFGAP
jgi:hypothetical protein